MTERTHEIWLPFGKMVRAARLEQGLTHRGLAERIQSSHGLISKIENAKRATSKETVLLLDTALKFDGKLVRRWESVIRTQSSPDWFQRAKEYEEQAREMKFFHPLAVPGFFQTPEYSQLVITASSPGITGEQLASITEARRAWRQRLRVGQGLVLNVVIPESAFIAARHEPEVMRGQIDRLLDEAEARSTTIQVLPATSRDLTWTCGAFRLLYLRDTDTLLCAEHALGEEFSDAEEQVSNMEAAFSRLQAWALPPDASRDKMTDYRGSL
ncbi:helix-turn-helix transcriptional regulator [Nocardiopsis sp. CNT-189]|uniref:helix-turn-helix domain-containing protein n=1 Tax=Nocardiopsis oceanisediminis TaxID=2816862 RepID=UPI003B38BF2E